MKDDIRNILEESIRVKKECIGLADEIEAAARAIVECLRNSGKVVIFGNGGSAADSQHIAAEFVNKFRIERQPLPAIALTTDTSIITAIGNYSGFDCIFERQIKAIGRENDVAIAITTSDISESGHSANIYKGILAAKAAGMKIIGLGSNRSIKMSDLTDIAIKVPSESTPRTQEAHITIMHAICELVEKELFG